MYFSPTIGGYDLYETWHLVPTTRPHVNFPEIRTTTVEVPGRNGVIDFTEAFGGPTYENRKGEWQFLILQDIDPETGRRFPSGERYTFEEVIDGLKEHIHGKKLYCTLEDNSDTYYGRFVISDISSNKDYSTVTISYEIDP